MAGQWELRIKRSGEQTRSGRRRTVSTYQVFHDGTPVAALKGAMAETRGPGANTPAENNRCVELGTYNLHIQDGEKYATIGYTGNTNQSALRRPGLPLLPTGARVGILIHPGRGFLSSIGCINPTGSLANADNDIGFVDSRSRVIALIDDLKTFLGAGFPTRGGAKIPGARVIFE